MENAVFWDVMPCGSGKNRRFGGTYHLQHHGDKKCELGTTLALTSHRRMLQIVTDDVVLTSEILVTLIMEVILCSETSVLTTATRCNINSYNNRMLITQEFLNYLLFISLREHWQLAEAECFNILLDDDASR
jgi:hypothetical protein